MRRTQKKHAALCEVKDLDNMKCPKCQKAYDFETRRSHSGTDDNDYLFRVFEIQKHNCNEQIALQKNIFHKNLQYLQR